LYILFNDRIYFYGPTLDLPTPVFNFPPNDTNRTYTAKLIKSIDIDDSLNVAYTFIQTFKTSPNTFYNNLEYGCGINFKNPNKLDRRVACFDLGHNDSYPLSYVRYDYYSDIQIRGKGDTIYLNERENTFYGHTPKIWLYENTHCPMNYSRDKNYQYYIYHEGIGLAYTRDDLVYKVLEDLPINAPFYQSKNAVERVYNEDFNLLGVTPKRLF